MGYNTHFDGVLYFNDDLPVKAIKHILCTIANREATYNGKKIYIQFEVTKGLDGIQWDGSEKFYDAVDAVNYIIEKVKSVYPNFSLSGEITAQGEDSFDRWKLAINDKGRAYKKEIIGDKGKVHCPHCGKDFNLE